MKKHLLFGVACMLLLLPLGLVAQIDCTTTTNFDTGVCYTNGTVTEIQADICPDDPTQAVTLTFTAGEVENSWDELEVYEGAMGSGTGGTQLYSGYGTGGDLTGLVVDGTLAGGCLSVYVNADGSGDCPGNGYVTPVFDASCLVLPSCADPSALVATSITDVTAQLDWTYDVANCTGDEYWVLPTGSAMPSSGTGTATGCGSAAAMGLTASTTYDVWVQTDCSAGGLSGIINIGSFTTTAAPPDCTTAEVVTCGTSFNTPILDAVGAWNPDGASPGACFATPTGEKVYSFTPDISGDYTITISDVSGTGWVDYFYRTDGVCEEANWICISDVFSTTETHTIAGLTAGVEVYILVDGESSYADRIHEVLIDCICVIDGVTAVSNDDCDPSSDLYSADVTVTSTNPIATGDLNVNGQLFPSTGTSPQVVTLTGLIADGNPVDVTAFYTDDTDCTFTAAAAFTAPMSCVVGCNIASVVATPTACMYDGTVATYDVDVEVSYTSPMGTLDVDVNGNMMSVAATTSPQIVSFTGLTPDGMTGLSVTASFSGDAMCTGSTTYDSPEDCTPTGCVNTSDFGTANMDGTNTPVQVSTCSFTTEYTTVNNVETGEDYEFSVVTGGVDKYVTITDDMDNILAFGPSPFTWTSTVTGTVRAHWTEDADCNTASTCHTTTVTCTTCPAPCNISDVTAGTPSPCNPSTNTYIVDVTVTYTDAPSTGTLDINGTSFAITSSPQTESLELPADGSLVTLVAAFSDDAACTFTLADAFTAPMDCAVDCTINAITIGTTGECTWDGTSATFTQTVTVDYSVPPAGGTLDVTVGGTMMSFAIGTSPQEVMISGIPADGMTLDVTAVFSADAMCTLTEMAAVTAPTDYCTPPDCAASPVLACGETINTGDLSGLGAWNPDNAEPGLCFSTPGDEFVFQFVATDGGDYTLDIALSSGTSSWNDYFYRTDEMCEETGWICLDDIATTATLTIPGVTAGATVYVLVDSETSGAGRIHDVTLGCPPPPIANAGGVGLCQNAAPIMVDGTNAKVNLLVAGEIIAAINSNGQDLGMVESSYVRYDPMDNTTRDYSNAGAGGDGYDLMDRSIVITPAMQPASPVSVFLYYTDDEYNEIIANADGDNASASWADLGITKFPTDVCADMTDPQNLSGDIVTILGTTAVTGGWEVEIEVSSFSGFQAHEGTTALPIKLNRFTAKEDGRHNKIEWSTSSEIDVQDHRLMKSNDASNWEILDIVEGNINSTTNIDYEMMDAFPYEITYYQLMTTDLDGSVSYSPIVSVARDTEELSAFLGASPVPTRDVVNLNVYSQTEDNLTITLTDISGKRILVSNKSITQGNHQLPLDLSNMTNGVYLVTITSDYISQTHRVIKN